MPNSKNRLLVFIVDLIWCFDIWGLTCDFISINQSPSPACRMCCVSYATNTIPKH